VKRARLNKFRAPVKATMIDRGKYITSVTGNKLWEIVRFEVFTAVTMKNGVFWDVTPCGSCKNRRFGGK
jgi:hypothetical protein